MNLLDEAQLLRARAEEQTVFSRAATTRAERQYYLGVQRGYTEAAQYLELSHQLHQLGNMQRKDNA